MIIDSIEGAVAVVETAKGEYHDIPLRDIDGDAHDGDVLVERGGRYVVDEDSAAARRRRLDDRRRRLFSGS